MNRNMMRPGQPRMMGRHHGHQHHKNPNVIAPQPIEVPKPLSRPQADTIVRVLVNRGRCGLAKKMVRKNIHRMPASETYTMYFQHALQQLSRWSIKLFADGMPPPTNAGVVRRVATPAPIVQVNWGQTEFLHREPHESRAPNQIISEMASIVARPQEAARKSKVLHRQDTGRSVAAQLAMNVHGVPEADEYMRKAQAKEMARKHYAVKTFGTGSSTRLSLSDTIQISDVLPMPNFGRSKSQKSLRSLGSLDRELDMDFDSMVNNIIGNLDDITEDELSASPACRLKRMDTGLSEAARDDAILTARKNAFNWDSWAGENDEMDNQEEPEWANEDTPEWADCDMNFQEEFDFEASRKAAEGMFFSR